MHRVGLPWYSSATYARAVRLMEDRAQFPETFEAWQRNAELQCRGLQKDGTVIYRVIIDPDEFGAWCRRQDIVPNAAARERFAEIAARRLFREPEKADIGAARGREMNAAARSTG